MTVLADYCTPISTGLGDPRPAAGALSPERVRQLRQQLAALEAERRRAWDALVLAAMGADHLGQPLTPMPATHRTALNGVQWPDQEAQP